MEPQNGERHKTLSISHKDFDILDLKIIRTLGNRGHIKNIDLANAVGLSPSACHQRTVRLKKMGVLRGFAAEIDVSKISPYIRVMTLLMLERQSTNEYRRMNQKICETPQIVRAYRISGDFDYALETLAPNFDCYRAIIERLLEGDVAIKQYQSRIMQEEVKSANDYSALSNTPEAGIA